PCRRGLAGLPFARGHGARDRRHRGRALHGVLHRRLSRSGAARARAGRARDGSGGSVSLSYKDADVNGARAQNAHGKVKDRVARVVGAMADSCSMLGVALIGGETAEMPGMYASDTYDLAGFLVGVVDRAKILGPERVREGDALVGFPSSGLHTNGFSLAREICARRAMHERSASLRDVLLAPREELGGATLGASLLAVHRSYLAEFRALREVAAIHSIAHLTGGGWEGNLPRSLPDGTAASIDRASWEVPAIFSLLARLGDLEEMEQFDTWNMGIGLVVAIPADAVGVALGAVRRAVAP